ncbi:MAG: N-acetylneuraminate synthase family protein [Muribaculaceae bacterium]|nr:N-acetylneuraminate synthase family protein [Muribaculaceae bacterium]
MAVIIIAEAGVNHNGDLRLAREMVKAAKRAGADYVKFQTAKPELVISTFAPKAEYQKSTTGESESQLDMCRAIHLPLSDYAGLKALCEEEGIGFMSTPFDLESVSLLAELGQDWMKVPSGEITNLPYLRAVARSGQKVILSTVMARMEEIDDAVKILTGQHPDYPTESSHTPEQINYLHLTLKHNRRSRRS